MVGMEFALLGSVLLGIWVVRLFGPLDSVAHTFHDSYHFYGVDVEVVL